MARIVRISRFKLAGLGGFADDIGRERQRALAAGDDKAANELKRLWLDHLEVRLAALSVEELVRHLQSRPIWRQEGSWNVIKTPDTPCIAFTSGWAGDELEVIGVAACYRYPPGGEELWWQRDVRPRVQRL